MKKWRIPETDKALAKRIAAGLELDEFLVLLLTVRGFKSAESIQGFLMEDTPLSDPFLIKDMDKAVERIRAAIDAFEPVAVFGDYDADGITATALLYSYLETCGTNVMYYIPEREGEGYGISNTAIDKLSERGIQLVITVDNGISAAREVAYARTLGMDVVVTDHHQPGDELPAAYAVVDPHRADCESPCKELAGVGVAFKLICAMEGADGDMETVLENFSELVAIGTVADIVPLTGENRVLVRHGLRQMAQTDRPGLRALVDEAGLDIRQITSTNVAFGLAPRMNATGRMGSPLRSVQLLIAEDEEEARLLAAALGDENRNRQSTESEILDKIQEALCMHPERLLDRVLVVDGEDFHQGVIGIVASRLLERYGKPVIVLAREGDIVKGSGRSLPGFSLHAALSHCADLLIKFGGHEMAAGLSMEAGRVEELRERLNAYAAGCAMPLPELPIDLKLNPAGLSTHIVHELAKIEPFGCDNPAPLFALMGMTLSDITPVGGGKHLRLTVTRGDAAVTVMRFHTRLEMLPYRKGDVIDLAVTLDASQYRGEEQLSVYARDIRFSDVDYDRMFSDKNTYEMFARGENPDREQAQSLLPGRGDFAEIYRYLRDNKGWRHGPEMLYCRLKKSGVSYARLLCALDILVEKGLIERSLQGGREEIALLPVNGKADLETGVHIDRLRSAMA